MYASIAAFGQHGPYRDLAAHDLATEAMTGVLSLNRGGDGKPAMPALANADMLASMMTLSGVLMALLRRKETGRGDYLDMAMADCLLACLPNNMGTAMTERRQPDPNAERALGGNALYQIYETKDGDHVVLAGQELKFARNLLEPLGRPDLVELCKLPPGPGQDPVRAFLKEIFATKNKERMDRMVPRARRRLCADAHAARGARGRALQGARHGAQGRARLGPAGRADRVPRRARAPGLRSARARRAYAQILRTWATAKAEIAQLAARGAVKVA